MSRVTDREQLIEKRTRNQSIMFAELACHRFDYHNINENHKQKLNILPTYRTIARKFSMGGVCVCAEGFDILKIDKDSTDLCFMFQLGGLGALFGGHSPQKTPVAAYISI